MAKKAGTPVSLGKHVVSSPQNPSISQPISMVSDPNEPPSPPKESHLMRTISVLLLIGLAGCTTVDTQYMSNAPRTSLGATDQVFQKVIVDYDHVDSYGIVEIPIDLTPDNDKPFIWGVVNDKVRVRFVLDTGASTVTLSQETIKRIIDASRKGDEGISSVERSSATVASGDSVPLAEFFLDTLEIGQITLENVKAGTILTEGGGADLLGMSFLGELGEFTIDIAGRKLRVRPSDTYRAVPRAAFFPTADQEYVEAMQHWDSLAESEVTAITEALGTDSTPLVILKEKASEIPFISAYGGLLAKYLMRRGKTVLMENPGDNSKVFEVNYKILVAGHERTSKEVLITTEVTDKKRLVFTNSRVYYLNESDEDNYHKRQRQGFKAVGCSSGVAC
jgi:clan AA aspartic protease (TIGR02281 family)